MTQFLSEGISSIEDLDVQSFISAVRNLGRMQATERLDGIPMWLGVDESGKVFISRPDGTDRFFNEADYPFKARFNSFRAATAVAKEVSTEVTSVLRPGETVEINVVLGRQPNVTTYGLDNKNYIAIVQSVNGTSEGRSADLLKALKTDVTVKFIVIESTDGRTLNKRFVSQTFSFTGLQEVKGRKIDNEKNEKLIQNLEDFLNEDSEIDGFKNSDILGSLTSIPKEHREEAKIERKRIISTIESKFKGPIKKDLLKAFVHKTKSTLSSADLTKDEDFGVAGVVLTDPSTGQRIKITDASTYKTIAAFNNAVKSSVSGSIRSTDDSAPLESRGGLIGQMRIRLAALLGDRNLAVPRAAKDIIESHLGKTPIETAQNLSKILHGDQDINGTRRKIIAVMEATLEELDNMLDSFNKFRNPSDHQYRLKLKNGKVIGLSQEAINQTLLAFAESRDELQESLQHVKKATTLSNVVMILFNDLIREVHRENVIPEPVQEALTEATMHVNKALYKAVPDWISFVYIYIATLLCTVLIYKADDKRGMRLVRDKAHWHLTKISDDMSPLNFWGYGLWKAGTPTVSKMLQPKVVKPLARCSRLVQKNEIRLLHMDFSFAKDLPIDWADHEHTIHKLIKFSDVVNTDRVRRLVRDTFKYEELTFSEKTQLLPKLYFLVQQYIPNSPLLYRIRVIQQELLSGTSPFDDAGVVMAPKQKLLGEDGEIALAAGPDAGAPNIATPVGKGTQASNVSSVENRVGRSPNIIRRKRNLNLDFKKFKRPEGNNQ